MKKLKTLAKKDVTIRDKTSELTKQLRAAEVERDEAKKELANEVKKRPSITGQLQWWNKALAAFKRSPKRLMAAIEEIMIQPPEHREPELELNKTKSRTEVR